MSKYIFYERAGENALTKVIQVWIIKCLWNLCILILKKYKNLFEI